MMNPRTLDLPVLKRDFPWAIRQLLNGNPVRLSHWCQQDRWELRGSDVVTISNLSTLKETELAWYINKAGFEVYIPEASPPDTIPCPPPGATSDDLDKMRAELVNMVKAEFDIVNNRVTEVRAGIVNRVQNLSDRLDQLTRNK